MGGSRGSQQRAVCWLVLLHVRHALLRLCLVVSFPPPSLGTLTRHSSEPLRCQTVLTMAQDGARVLCFVEGTMQQSEMDGGRPREAERETNTQKHNYCDRSSVLCCHGFNRLGTQLLHAATVPVALRTQCLLLSLQLPRPVRQTMTECVP